MTPTKANKKGAAPKRRPYLSHSTVTALVLPLLSPHEKKTLRRVCRAVRDKVDSHWASLTVRRTRNMDSGHHLAAVGGRWSRLRHLESASLDIDDATLRPMCAVKWAELESLELGDNALAARAGRLLAAAAPAWPRLRRLNLAHNKLGDEGVALLAAAEWPQLAELDLSHNGLGPAAAASLAATRWPLRALNLECNALGPTGVGALGKGVYLFLQELRLGGNALGFLGAAALGAAARDKDNRWPALRVLDVSDCGIGPEPAGWVDAFFVGEWDALEELNLAGNPVGGAAAASLGAFSWRLPALRRLVLDGAAVHEQGLARLFAAPWHSLEVLSVRGCAVRGPAAKALGQAAETHRREDRPRMPALRRLDLAGAGVHNEALKAILRGGWPHLEALNLTGCAIDVPGMATLARSAHTLPALRELRVTGPFSAKGLLALFQRDWPALERVWVGKLDPRDKEVEKVIRKVGEQANIQVLREVGDGD